MPIDQLLERRTLIAAINDPSLEVPQQFFIKNFWGAPRQTYSEIADILITKGSRGLARFRNLAQQGNVVGRVQGELITFRFPYIREKKVIEAAAIINPRSLGEVYVTSGNGIQEAKRQAIATDLQDLKNRILRREEWMASQLLTTGKIIYADEWVSFALDFQMPSSHKPVLSGLALWGASGADILGNLNTWSTLIQRATGRPGADVIMGETAAMAFLKDPTIHKLLDNNNLPAGRITIDVTAADLGTFGGFRFRRHSELYTADDGTTKNYMPENGILMLPTGFRTDRLFGVIPEVGQLYADPFFSKSWEEQDPSVLWILAAARPLPIIEEAGSWVYATVTA